MKMGFFNKNDDFYNNDNYNDDYYNDDQEDMSYGSYENNSNWTAGEAIMFIATLYFVMQIIEVILVAFGRIIGFLFRMVIRFVKFLFRKGKAWYSSYRQKKENNDRNGHRKQVL